VRRIETRRQPDAESPAAPSAPAPQPRDTRTPPPAARPAPRPSVPQPSSPPRRTVVFEDDLDVPDFLK